MFERSVVWRGLASSEENRHHGSSWWQGDVTAHAAEGGIWCMQAVASECLALGDC
jgi:hypothetical protein